MNIQISGKTALILFAFSVSTLLGCQKTEKAAQGEVLAKEKNGELWSVDTSQSHLLWTGKKITGQHNGTVDVTSGELYFNPEGDLTSGSISADMRTIQNSDIQDEHSRNKIVAHLKNPDFFDVENYPSATIEITGIQTLTGNKTKVDANLTIRGITNPVTFEADTVSDGDTKIITATTFVDRTLWDIKYKSGKFFSELGDKLIYDEMEIGAYLVLTR